MMAVEATRELWLSDKAVPDKKNISFLFQV